MARPRNFVALHTEMGTEYTDTARVLRSLNDMGDDFGQLCTQDNISSSVKGTVGRRAIMMNARGSMIFSCTTVETILLSGFGGSSTTPVASRLQPCFEIYSSRSESGRVPQMNSPHENRQRAKLTSQTQIRPQSLLAYPLERSLHAPHDHLPDRILKAHHLDRVIIPQRLEFF